MINFVEEKKLNLVKDVIDVIQIGARNMQNFPLITAAAKTKKPILLKRHFGSSIRDLLGSAEYALLEKNEKVIHPVSGKPILKFVSIFRKKDSEWAIPGGMVDPGENISQTLKREFAEEALDSNNFPER